MTEITKQDSDNRSSSSDLRNPNSDFCSPNSSAPRLLVPVRITEQVWSKGSVPAVTIQCITFEHRNFIRDAIEGFLMQETTFPVEIIVHDDASTDGTVEMIREYAEKHPRLFKTILQKENLYSSGNFGKAVEQIYALTCGEFIALCEGDDYWSDPAKLQIQVEFLEKNTRFSCCFHRSRFVDEKRNTIKNDYFVPSEIEFDFRDCLTNLKKRYATCSMLFRTKALANPRPWFLNRPTDMFLELQLALNGKIGYINRNMSAYRKHSSGVWMGASAAQKNLEQLYRYQLLLADSEIRKGYGNEIFKFVQKLELGFCLKTDCEELLCNKSIFYRIARFFEDGFEFLIRKTQNLTRSIFGFANSFMAK